MSEPLSEPLAPPRSWWQRRITDPVLGLLRQGLTPHQLALTVVLGSACGVVPVLGLTTLTATFAALRLRLNVAATLLIAHLWSPVQLLLVIPLLRQGALLWGDQAPELTLDKLRYLLASDWLAALQLLWQAMLGALLLWAGAFLVLGPVVYFVLRPLLARAMRNKSSETTAVE